MAISLPGPAALERRVDAEGFGRGDTGLRAPHPGLRAHLAEVYAALGRKAEAAALTKD